MRKISADYIFPISSAPIKNGVVVIDDSGKIIEVTDATSENIERYKGIICPGFINTHCHLELSHLKGKMKVHKGIAEFIKQLLEIRSVSAHNDIKNSIQSAEKEMIENGIVAVGDISNSDSSFEQKAKNNLWYHTFIEVIGFRPDKADKVFSESENLLKHYKKAVAKGNGSISPHAPYTVSSSLLDKINTYASENDSIVTIHNQESKAEEDFFLKGKSNINTIFDTAKVNIDFWKAKPENSLRTFLPAFSHVKKILLVHNTYTSREDLQWINSLLSAERRSVKMDGLRHFAESPSDLADTTPNSRLYFCTCPNANLFIENKLPDYNSFIAENATMTVGTDSYASNWSLSILDELKTISKHFPGIPLETQLIWATKNGAEFFGIENRFGTIEEGKKPGLVLIKNVDMKKVKLTGKSCVQVLA